MNVAVAEAERLEGADWEGEMGEEVEDINAAERLDAEEEGEIGVEAEAINDAERLDADDAVVKRAVEEGEMGVELQAIAHWLGQ